MPWPTVLRVTGRRQLGREAAGASGLGEGVRRHLSEGVQQGGPGSVSLAVASKVLCLIFWRATVAGSSRRSRRPTLMSDVSDSARARRATDGSSELLQPGVPERGAVATDGRADSGGPA